MVKDGGVWNAPLETGESVLYGIFYQDSYYSKVVDTWYIINQCELTWPKTREGYWGEMAKRNFSRSNWEKPLPMK